jgi:hypothetical protein
MLMLFLQMDLPPREEYSGVIDVWVDAWTKLRAHVDISEINNIHIINSHLKAYYDRTGLSLSRYFYLTKMTPVVCRKSSWLS